jgi:hypothetical protein
MNNMQPTAVKKAHLKVAIIFLGGWLFIAYIIYQNVQELGGLSGLMNEIRSGGYSDLVLLVFSIFLLAQFFRNLFKYLSFKDGD